MKNPAIPNAGAWAEPGAGISSSAFTWFPATECATVRLDSTISWFISFWIPYFAATGKLAVLVATDKVTATRLFSCAMLPSRATIQE